MTVFSGQVQKVNKSLKYSVLDGSAFSAMLGLTQSYIPPFDLANVNFVYDAAPPEEVRHVPRVVIVNLMFTRHRANEHSPNGRSHENTTVGPVTGPEVGFPKKMTKEDVPRDFVKEDRG